MAVPDMELNEVLTPTSNGPNLRLTACRYQSALKAISVERIWSTSASNPVADELVCKPMGTGGLWLRSTAGTDLLFFEHTGFD